LSCRHGGACNWRPAHGHQFPVELTIRAAFTEISLLHIRLYGRPSRILRDGVKNLRTSTAELIDGMPRELDSDDIASDARQLEAALRAKYPGAEIRMRESGRYMLVQIAGVAHVDNIMAGIEPLERPWRLEIASVEVPSEGTST